MSGSIVTHLFNTYYQSGRAVAGYKASAHWKNFSRQFRVDVDEAGNVQHIKGFGFGGSDDTRTVARLMSAIGNTLMLAKLDYPGLRNYIREARQTVADMGLVFSQDAFRQACTAYFIKTKAREYNQKINNVLIIGDGHGILAALLAKQFPSATIFLIDLGPTLFYQAYYLGKTFPEKEHTLAGFSKPGNTGSGFFYCPADSLQHFPVTKLDLAINIASMQEMTMDVINNYFQLLRRSKTDLFYCCNRLEKTLADGSVIRFTEYPWSGDDVYLVDERCAWHQFFVGRAASPHVTLAGIIPVPLLHRYDGVHWHRLAKLSH